mmetsp:Transcript_45967/g.133172  ORF Transcript_45967/g.133172 Transcript_45967/m.133172 type:complete len:88 (-) Transcript_45967:2-265(-)
MTSQTGVQAAPEHDSALECTSQKGSLRTKSFPVCEHRHPESRLSIDGPLKSKPRRSRCHSKCLAKDLRNLLWKQLEKRIGKIALVPS